MDLQLQDKVAIITGSSRGLGLASAQALAAEGARVTICARGAGRLEEAATLVRGAARERASAQTAVPADPRSQPMASRPTSAPAEGSDRVLAVAADLATSGGVAEVVAQTVSAFGGIDILVNNVGLGKGAGLLDTPDETWQEAFDQTLFPALRAARAAVPHMKARGGGVIIFITSIWGRESGGRMTYNAVKAAEISLSKSLARELARDNIRVNSIAPGSILFPGGSWHARQQADPDGIADMIRRDLPFGRFGNAEEVGAVVAFLASPRASWIAGACLPVDGCQGRANI
jgi:3-oxoacyl-[acyl-carrier protein] reductase